MLSNRIGGYTYCYIGRAFHDLHTSGCGSEACIALGQTTPTPVATATPASTATATAMPTLMPTPTETPTATAVSYTHLDVYKRQVMVHTGVVDQDVLQTGHTITGVVALPSDAALPFVFYDDGTHLSLIHI